MKKYYAEMQSDTLFGNSRWDRDNVISIVNQLFPSCKVTRIYNLTIYDKESPMPKTWRNLFGLIKNTTQKQLMRYRLEFQFDAKEI